jgi:short-subunit dehydrogenase
MHVCLVAGAGPGMGLAIARRFAREGFALGLIARRADALEEAAGHLRTNGTQVAIATADLRDPFQAASAVTQLGATLGPATVLVYNAATWNQVPAMAIAPGDFRRDLDLCVTGALASAQAAYPAMREAGRGSMLFTGGGLALNPAFGAGVASLTAGKSALRGFVHALAGELAPDGIHVATVTIAGTVAPGTAFDPDRIAARFWALHAEPPHAWRVEDIFAG